MDDADWDPAVGLYATACHHQGIHTRMPQGSRVHPLRENAAQALELIGGGDPALRARGIEVLRTVLAHQDADPTSPTFGIWGYWVEEPPAAMAPPDYNWADFIGLTLCKLLHRHAATLDAGLLAATRTALARAGLAIFRRNVGPGYTNIAVKGAVVTACAGQLLDDPFLADYGARRMANWVAHTEAEGITEYNSPTYNHVALVALEAGLTIAPPGPFREAAAAAYRLVWTSLAEHYHQPTGQIAGPMSRCYSDLLSGAIADAIRDAAIAEPPVAPCPCPEDLRHHFRAPVAAAVERRHRFRAPREDRPERLGTTWMDQNACLGSVSADSLWWQRRCLLAYWNAADGSPVVAKLRLLKDERDWASAMAHVAQAGPRALVAISLLGDQGDHHVHLDRPADGVFELARLRLRLELHGVGASVRETADGFELAAGDHRLVVHALPGAWGALPLAWSCTPDEDGVAVVDGTLAGPRRGVDPAQAPPLHLACAVELVASDAPAAAPPRLAFDADRGRLDWADHGLTLDWPLGAQPYR